MRRLLMLALLLFSVMIPAPSPASDAVEFSALFIEKDNGTEQRGKIYVAENMSRYEIQGSNEVVVTRHDKKVIWLIFPKLRIRLKTGSSCRENLGQGGAARNCNVDVTGIVGMRFGAEKKNIRDARIFSKNNQSAEQRALGVFR